MLVQEIPLENIDFNDERYRMSYFRDPTAVRRSVAAVGLLNPPWLWQAQAGAPYTIICGYQRLLAGRDLNQRAISARIYRADDLSALDAFRLALFDNLAVRAFNPVEKAKILQRLRQDFQMPGAEIVSQYHRLLDLPPQRAVLEDYLRLAIAPTERQIALVQDRISLPTALRLTRLAAPDAAALFRLMTELRLGVNRQREMFDWLEEIARASGRSVAQVATQPEIEALLSAGHQSPGERAESVRQLLRAWRFPHLTQQEARFQVHATALCLPPGLRLLHDPQFEDPWVRIELTFTSAPELRTAAQSLLNLADHPALRNLLDLL